VRSGEISKTHLSEEGSTFWHSHCAPLPPLAGEVAGGHRVAQVAVIVSGGALFGRLVVRSAVQTLREGRSWEIQKHRIPLKSI